MEGDKVEKVSWNVGQGLIFQVAGLMENSNNHFLRGNTKKAFDYLRAIKRLIRPKLNSQERKAFTRIEAHAGKSMFEKTKLNFYYDKYSELLFDMLKKYGFYPSDMEDMTSLNR